MDDKDRIKAARLVAQKIGGQHAGHHITYTEQAYITHDIIGIIQPETVEASQDFIIDNIEDSFLYCETCNVKVSSRDIGLISDDWITA